MSFLRFFFCSSIDRVSYVKDYDGGTHMECYVHPTVPYMAQAEMFKKQRDFLVKRIADISTSTRVYHGLPAAAFEDGRIHPFDIPGEHGSTRIYILRSICIYIYFDVFCVTEGDAGREMGGVGGDNIEH